MSLHMKIKNKKLTEKVDAKKLIQLIKKHKIIYHPSFSRVKCPERETVWESIAKELGCEVESAKVKWTYLKDSYRNFLKRKEANKEIKDWKHAKEMEFMKPYLTNKKTDSTDDKHAYNETINDLPSTSKSKTEEPTLTQMEISDSIDVVEIISDEDNDAKPNTVEVDNSMNDNFDENGLDKSLGDKQPKSTTSNPNQTAMSSTITTTDLDAEDIVFLGYSKAIKKFPPIEKSRAMFRFARLIMEMQTEIYKASSQMFK